MNKRLMGAIAVGVSIMTAHAFGVPLVQEKWDANMAGWELGWEPEETGGHGALSFDNTLGSAPNGGSPGALRIDAAGDAQPQIDYIYVDSLASVDLTGNYGSKAGDSVKGIWFDFYIDANNASVPTALQLYFVGAGKSAADAWYFDLTPQLGSTGWGTYGANIDDLVITPSGWVTYGFGDWDDDILDVSEIGIELSYTVSGLDQIYAIDNFTLDDEPFLVPEPETYAFLAMAVLALGLVFRQRVNESMQMMMARIRI